MKWESRASSKCCKCLTHHTYASCDSTIRETLVGFTPLLLPRPFMCVLGSFLSLFQSGEVKKGLYSVAPSKSVCLLAFFHALPLRHGGPKWEHYMSGRRRRRRRKKYIQMCRLRAWFFEKTGEGENRLFIASLVFRPGPHTHTTFWAFACATYSLREKMTRSRQIAAFFPPSLAHDKFSLVRVCHESESHRKVNGENKRRAIQSAH